MTTSTSSHTQKMPPNSHCTLDGNTDFNELPRDILNIKTKEDPTHTSQSNSSSVTHHCMSQPKSSAAPLPRVSKLMSSAAVHRTSQPKSSSAPPPPHVSKPNKSYTKDHHQPQKPKKKPVVSAPNKSNERPNKNPHIWPSPVDDLLTVPPKIPPPNRASLFTADDTIQIPSNQAPMLPSQVIIWYPTAPSTEDLETDQQRRSATNKQRRDKRTKLTEKENKNMSKLPSQTNPPNTTYLRPRQPTDALRDAVSLVANWQQPDPEHCKFKFDISPEAAEHNLGIIRGHQYDLDAALKAEGGTALRYGSEFKPPSILGLLLENHPLWDSISSSLSNGIKYPLEQITCHARRRSTQQAIDRGNHKSARDQPEKLVELLTSDVHSGFTLPLPTKAIFKIPDADMVKSCLSDRRAFNSAVTALLRDWWSAELKDSVPLKAARM
jgi:hypothetical protein